MTVSSWEKYRSVVITAQQSTAGLHLLIDRSGIRMHGRKVSKTRKHDEHFRRQWHITPMNIDAMTMEIPTIEVRDNTAEGRAYPALQ